MKTNTNITKILLVYLIYVTNQNISEIYGIIFGKLANIPVECGHTRIVLGVLCLTPAVTSKYNIKSCQNNSCLLCNHSQSNVSIVFYISVSYSSQQRKSESILTSYVLYTFSIM